MPGSTECGDSETCGTIGMLVPSEELYKAVLVMRKLCIARIGNVIVDGQCGSIVNGTRTLYIGASHSNGDV